MSTEQTDKRYPRVLVVCADPMNTRTSHGFCMTNLFRGWPKERLAQVYSDPKRLETEVCERYWKLSPTAGLRLGPKTTSRNPELSSGARGGNASPEAAQASSGAQDRPVPVPLWARRSATALADFVPYRLTPEFWQWMDEFRPESLYVATSSVRMMRVAVQVSDRYRATIVPHFPDDWVTSLYRHTPLAPVARPILMAWLRAVLRRSGDRFAIGPTMAREYEQRLGGRFLDIMNCVDPELMDSYVPDPPDSEAMSFCFIGNLEHGRAAMARSVGEALLKLRSSGLVGRLVVHSSPRMLETYSADLDLPEVILARPAPSNAELPQVLRESHCFVHLDSFEPSERRYFRLSMSSKLPLYLAAGRPILAYGPAEVATLRYVVENGTGLVVGEPNPEALAEALRKLMVSPELRQQMGRRARETALARHEAYSQRERLREVLARAAAGTTPHV
ncbi:MAG TPA: glycosyltransferase [Armatimonadota bacterium]